MINIDVLMMDLDVWMLLSFLSCWLELDASVTTAGRAQSGPN